MGTVLSINPKDRHNPIYSGQHYFQYNQQSEIKKDTNNDNINLTDSQLNNFSYEQLNNAKNRENKKIHCPQYPKNGNRHSNGCSNVKLSNLNSNNIHHINNSTKDTINNDLDFHNENSVILSEKGNIEKHLKKHSIFMNALSWKKISSHSRKKIDYKSKCSNLPVGNLKTQLIDSNYSSVGDKNKNSHNNCNYNDEHQNINIDNQDSCLQYLSSKEKNKHKLDIVKVNNTNCISNHNKLVQKQPLTISLPSQLQSTALPTKINNNGPRKTVIQVSFNLHVTL
ncbi:putative uncharacterized protein DDB_G0282133 [Calliphora vicina]|uniref:putative uncharacterized protein DDB_G0282133 n=1 Tax=Calliphora vicina TaxID=7373 RepID=UPI00325BD4B0